MASFSNFQSGHLPELRIYKVYTAKGIVEESGNLPHLLLW